MSNDRLLPELAVQPSTRGGGEEEYATVASDENYRIKLIWCRRRQLVHWRSFQEQHVDG